MSVQVHAFPVRVAETLNRLGSTRMERAAVHDEHGDFALVTIRERSFVARTHGERVTRRGRQTLVSVHGRLTWVASHRVQALQEHAA